MQELSIVSVLVLQVQCSRAFGRIKAWTSRTVDRFRNPARVRFHRHHQRRQLFEGRNRQPSLLARPCDEIDTQAIERPRQLWAEARRLYSGGAAWWLLNREAVNQAHQDSLHAL
jgi:predicted P-loop ATPase